MKVVVVSEAFAPKNNEIAETARRIVDGLLETRSHNELLVVTTGAGTSSYRGARVVRSRGLATASAVAGIIEPFDADVVLTISPKLIGSLATRFATRNGIASVTVNPPSVHARASLTLATHRQLHDQLDGAGVSPRLWTPGTDPVS